MTRRFLLTAWFVGFAVTFPAFAGKKVEFNATVRTDVACELGYRIVHVKKNGGTDEYCAIGPKAAEPLLQKNVDQTVNIKGHDGMHGQLLVLWVDKVAGEPVTHRDWTGGILTGAAVGLNAAAAVEASRAGQTTTTTVYSPPAQPTSQQQGAAATSSNQAAPQRSPQSLPPTSTPPQPVSVQIGSSTIGLPYTQGEACSLGESGTGGQAGTNGVTGTVWYEDVAYYLNSTGRARVHVTLSFRNGAVVPQFVTVIAGSNRESYTERLGCDVWSPNQALLSNINTQVSPF